MRGEQNRDDTASLFLAEDDDWQKMYAPGKLKRKRLDVLPNAHPMTGFWAADAGVEPTAGRRPRWVYQDTGSVFLRRRSADVA